MKIRFSITLLLALSLVLLFVIQVSSFLETWVPHVPDNAAFRYWIESEMSYVTVSVWFYDSGFNISDWGTVNRDGSDFSANSKFWDWTGYAAYVVWVGRHNYSLGKLEEGVYTFTFKGWGYEVESMAFEVGFPADVNNDSKVDIKDIGIVALAYGSHNPDPNYNFDADIYYDGKVDIKDIAFTAAHYGEAAP